MADRRTNFLVTLVFDENLHIGKQIDTEYSFKNEIIKDLQHLIKGKEIKHFVIADDEVINDKLKEEPKTGHWIKQTLTMPLSDSTKECVMCSECKTHWDLEYKFCPNCGAKMESEDK